MGLAKIKPIEQSEREMKSEKKFQLSHILVMMLAIMLFACLLTYVIPAGDFQYTDDGEIVAGTYHAIEQTPVNPLMALVMILDGGVKAISIIIILVMGGFFGAIFQLDSVMNVINYLIQKFEKAGPNMLVLGLYSLMGLIGFFIGGDAMIVFVTLGVMLTKRLRLDPIMALAITFPPLFMAFSISPSGMAMLGQIVSDGVPLFSGYGMRTIMYLVFFIITAIYVMFYAKRIIKDPANSVMNNDKWLQELDKQDQTAFN